MKNTRNTEKSRMKVRCMKNHALSKKQFSCIDVHANSFLNLFTIIFGK